eukprot:COSAG02_NODE_4854_length_4899_cov_4.794375_2_plen_117_part_01
MRAAGVGTLGGQDRVWAHIFGDLHERLLNVGVVLRGGLEAGDVALRCTPCLGALERHLPVLKITLVAQHHEREVLRIPRPRLDQELVPPAFTVVERLKVCQVVHKHARVGTAVERDP